jgi:hypothetical protein
MAEIQKHTPHPGGLAGQGEEHADRKFFEFPTGDEGVIRVPSPYLSLKVTPPSAPTRPDVLKQDDGDSEKTNRTGTPHVSSGELRGHTASEFTERPVRRAD